MYFSFAICTVATALVLVRGQEYNHTEPEGPHQYTEIGHCKNQREKFMISRTNAALKPRERHVVLKPEEGFEFDPSTVTVKRCIGACSHRLSPMPMKTEPKSFVVQLKRQGEHGMPMKCVSVTVMEHAACKCMCMKNEDSCNERQYFDAKKCACNCKVERMGKPKCNTSAGMVWSDETCACQCQVEVNDCPNSWRWDKKSCKCSQE